VSASAIDDAPRLLARDPSASAWDRLAAFLVWGTPDLGPRSRALAHDLGISRVAYVHTQLRRGRVSTVLRYPLQAAITLRWLARTRPRIVFVQHPPSVGAWVVALYAWLTGGRYVLDCHSATFQRRHWHWPAWAHRVLLRRAKAVLVTQDHWATLVARDGGCPMVVPDIPIEHPDVDHRPLAGSFRIAVVNTWAPDEPITAIIEAACACPDVDFFVTGRISRAPLGLAPLPRNMHLTDFLPEPRYLGLLSEADAVMCLTTRDHTMQRGACEALALGTPIVTSGWPILREHFATSAVFVDNTPQGIVRGLRLLMEHYAEYVAATGIIRHRRRQEWLDRKHELAARLLPRS
jgi:hypothetical protein